MPRSDLKPSPPKKRPPLFWWFLANTLAIAFAIAAWMTCLSLFRDPTHPTSYGLMLKFGRIDPIAIFTPEDAPDPQMINDPRELEARFVNFPNNQLDTFNRELRRAYLTNFKKAPFLTYLTGEFRVVESRLLTADDFIHPGLAVKAQALIRPDPVADALPYPVFIDCLFPAADPNIESFQPDQVFALKRFPDCAALLNIGSTDYEDRKVIIATVVTLTANEFDTPGSPPVKITPPPMPNPAATLPALP